jgi:hypothetical protein
LKNWFSLASAQRVYQSFLALDRDQNGTLSKQEFRNYSFDPRIADQCSNQGFSDVFVDLLFAVGPCRYSLPRHGMASGSIIERSRASDDVAGNGTGRYCLPYDRLPVNSRDEGLNRVE